MVDTLAQIAADPKVRRTMQEEYWAAQNEILWENQVETLTEKIGTLSSEIGTLSSKNLALSSEILKLRQLLQQAGIDISLLDKQKN